jgi:DNA-directed RNA polymerase specialized sigma24 family protein
MEQHKTKWREPARAAEAEQLLASYYNQLLKWGAVLTRGDEGKAQDIVHEFCLYVTLAMPDLSGVANLDGYLYTSLRHIYLSGLARSSREAQHFISVAEFDSVESALVANRSDDPLQRQNDLRRICGYAVWRKESSKSSSYFILHFFHGYSRREIAELACLPISAIYNKLKVARTEVKSYLHEPDKLRIVNRNLPPGPALQWSLSPPDELFRELHETILHARVSECLSEEELLAPYYFPTPRPIACSLLAHIVSCERCLAIIDRYFRRPTLQDREPLDGFGPISEGDNNSITRPRSVDNKAMLRSLHKRWGKVHEHRPGTLSIAVNGKIIAFHDVQAEHSTLSARIEYPEKAQFVEVFSEQDVRLAFLPIGDLPPEGPHIRSQRVALSDDRWLELKLTFDGLGLNSQVAYSDPALGIEAIEDTEESAVARVPKSTDAVPSSYRILWPRILSIATPFTRFFSAMVPSSAMAWALALTIIIGTTGYLVYRHATAPIDAREILNQSVKMETADLQGQTEHQVLRLEEVSGDGQVLQRGAVDLWKDGDGNRYVRRLYDSQHHLIAVKWRNKNGEHTSSKMRGDKDVSGSHHPLPMSDLWDQDLSAHAFSLLKGKASQVHAVEGGYELTTIGPVEGRPQLISATLVLDRKLLPVKEIMHVQAGSEIHEIRFIQTGFERTPSPSVPDTVFDPEYELHSTQNLHSSVQEDNLPNAIRTDLRLAQLQIAVLYQLNLLGADTGEPIEVVRTSNGHIRVSGAVVDSSLKQEIVSHLEILEDHQLLDLRLILPRDAQTQGSGAQRTTPEDTSVYDVSQAMPEIDATLRKYFQTKGLSGERLDTVIRQYSLDALQHAQRALQHAYALNRLGNALSATELKSIDLSSQQQWTEMVDKHAADLQGQLGALHGQLAEIYSSGEALPDAGNLFVQIENPMEFNHAANQLLHQTQDLNSDVGRLFTSNPSGERHPAQDGLLATTLNAIPLRQSKEIARFATQLSSSGGAVPVNRQGNGDDKMIPDPR